MLHDIIDYDDISPSLASLKPDHNIFKKIQNCFGEFNVLFSSEQVSAVVILIVDLLIQQNSMKYPHVLYKDPILDYCKIFIIYSIKSKNGELDGNQCSLSLFSIYFFI